MSFPEAVQTVLTKKFADFSGRASRSEWWWWALAWTIVDLVIGGLDKAIGSQIIGYVFILATLIPGLAAAARRLHDTDRSAWWLLLILLLGIGWIVLAVFYILEGTPGDNQYGPPPIGQGGGYNPNVDPNAQWG